MAEALIFELHPNFLMENDTVGIQFTNTGSTALFEHVFKTHFKNLHAYAYSFVKEEAAAEEIVQNVFCKLWEKKENIQAGQSVTAYLYRAVHNESLNYLKHAKVKAAYQAHTAYSSNHQEVADPAVQKELQHKIDKAINELPEQCRTIFQLSRFEGLRYRMIADQLGISVKTVENQMGKALKVLRAKLAEYLPILCLLFINLEKFVS